MSDAKEFKKILKQLIEKLPSEKDCDLITKVQEDDKESGNPFTRIKKALDIIKKYDNIIDDNKTFSVTDIDQDIDKESCGVQEDDDFLSFKTIVTKDEELNYKKFVDAKANVVLIPQQAIPARADEVRQIARVLKSTSFVPISAGRQRVKPYPSEGYNDYANICADKVSLPDKDKSKDEAIKNINKIAKTLLAQAEAEQIGYLSVKKSFKQKCKEKVFEVKEKFSKTKSKLFYTIVSHAKKLLLIK